MNYQREMEQQMQALPEGTPLLLHACCGPCSSAVLERLAGHFEVSVLFYNPNIAPAEEYERRLAALQVLLERLPCRYPVRLLKAEYQPQAFTKAARGMEALPEGGARCAACFALRLDEAARRAADGGWQWFATTLSVSPHKDAALLHRLGGEAAAKYGLHWLPADFKKKDGYRRSIQLSAEYGLYRQNYCGCEYSQAEKMGLDTTGVK